ncbi:PHB depolymerase family esterase [Aeromicrobium sp. Leaf350]|uniref:alpha/beta hydrolase family esterase n=1 Tax=Aeromicrobium sp. Leaf350 TaxID=2876565 RepID=UPI001E56B4BF|nr:PHB depolymerase family esterase [Aeromicrobium sp. Leaf350]
MGTRRWLARGLAAVSVVVMLAACTSGPDTKDQGEEPTFPPTGPCEVASERGDVVHKVDVGGDEREYLLYAPKGLPTDERIPVLYLFHGLGQEPEEAVAYAGLDEAAAEYGLIIVAPRGTGDPVGWDLDAGLDDPESDLAFVDAVTTAAVERHCGDPEQQYGVGISNGSALMFKVACEGDAPFVAFAGAAYISYGEECGSAPPSSFIYFHGTADAIVPYSGGQTAIGPVAPVADTLQQWIAHDACGEPTDEVLAKDVQQFEWACPESRIEAYVIDGGGHTWPGAPELPAAGVTTRSIDATEEVITFFGLDDRK